MNDYVKPNTPNIIIDNYGNEYSSARKLAKELGISKSTILKHLKRGEPFVYQGITYRLKDVNYIETKNEEKVVAIPKTEEQKEIERIINSEDYKSFLKGKEIQELPFEKYDFDVITKEGKSKYAIALFSDAHIEEVVKADSVLGLNEYNIEIAEERIQKYFINLVKALNEDHVENLIFAVLGDCVSGYIHEELAQTNSCSPLEATFTAQNLIYNGIEYIVKNSTVKHIKFIGIVGNHSRTTKKMQHANGHVMSYEWLMYKNIEKQFQLTNLPIEVEIPNSEMAVVQTSNGKKYMFMHGFQIKSSGNGTVCGIYPALNRLSLKLDRNFHQDKIYIGHFHSCISIPNATVNGSIIGFNTFSLSNGFSYEEPAQMYELFDENGLILTRKIYCR